MGGLLLHIGPMGYKKVRGIISGIDVCAHSNKNFI